MIEARNIGVSYGNIQVLWDLSFEISEDDGIVAIVGPNGAGKTTLLKVLSGLHPIDSGSVSIWGDDIGILSPTTIVERGFVHVTETRNLFGDMTVAENLRMGAYTHRRDIDSATEDVYDLFPVLEERRSQRAASMSGGQQQMLAIGRGLMARPKILALDEPSQGLAPKITQRLFERIVDISADTTVLLVEQHVHQSLRLAERAYLLENGSFVAEDAGPVLLESDHIEAAYL